MSHVLFLRFTHIPINSLLTYQYFRWFHGRLSSKECERLLLAKGKQGSYLVRESQSQPGQYALAVRCNNGVQQVIISHKEGKFQIKSGAAFSSLSDLIDYYVEKPKLRDIKDGSPIKLREVTINFSL